MGGGGDQPAGAVGNGIVRPGVVSATMGTSGVMFAHTPESGFDPLGRLQRGCHAIPDAWCAMGVVLAAAGSYQWFRNTLGQGEIAAAQDQGVDPYVLLNEVAAQAEPGSEGLFFLPYLTGERAPYYDSDARGCWIGLSVRHGRPELARSVLEGATYAMRDSLELIREMGVHIEQIRLSGGGARSPLWRQIQANIYGGDVHTVNAHEGPGFGVALLAMVGAGVFASVPEACDNTIRLADQTSVQPAAQAHYDQGYAIYRKLYADLKDSFAAISALVQN